jgi:hypothetical protein
MSTPCLSLALCQKRKKRTADGPPADAAMPASIMLTGHDHMAMSVDTEPQSAMDVALMNDDVAATLKLSPGSCVVQPRGGGTKVPSMEFFFANQDALMSMFRAGWGLDLVKQLASVSTDLREAARRHLRYCVMCKPLSIGMFATTSMVVDPELSQLANIPPLIPPHSGDFTNWDAQPYEGRFAQELDFFNDIGSSHGYDARLPRCGAPTIHFNNSMKDLQDPAGVTNHLRGLAGEK